MLTEDQQRAVIYMAAAWLAETLGRGAHVPVDKAWVHMVHDNAKRTERQETYRSPPRPPVGEFATIKLPSGAEISAYDQDILMEQLAKRSATLVEFWELIRPSIRTMKPHTPLWLATVLHADAVIELDKMVTKLKGK
jgi:hypothetical protein